MTGDRPFLLSNLGLVTLLRMAEKQDGWPIMKVCCLLCINIGMLNQWVSLRAQTLFIRWNFKGYTIIASTCMFWKKSTRVKCTKLQFIAIFFSNHTINSLHTNMRRYWKVSNLAWGVQGNKRLHVHVYEHVLGLHHGQKPWVWQQPYGTCTIVIINLKC